MRRSSLALLLFALPAFAGARPPVDDPVEPTGEPIPVVPLDDGTGVQALVRVQPFHTKAPFAYDHLAGAPPVSDGLVLVVRVRPDLARARNAANPVLYVGAVPMLVAARNAEHGCLAGLVPGGLDLAHEPVGFGSIELPERVDARRGAQEREALLGAGVAPRPAAEIAAARVPTSLDLADGDAVRAAAAEGIRACAPTP